MLRKLFLLVVPFLLLVHVTSAVALPPCPTDPSAHFHNCEGFYDFGNGDTYFGEWRLNTYHGQGTFTYASGDKYVGEYRDGKKNGHGTYTSANDSPFMMFGLSMAGMEIVGEFVDDYPNGNVTLYWANGDAWVGRMRVSVSSGVEWFGGKKYTADNVPPDLVRK